MRRRNQSGQNHSECQLSQGAQFQEGQRCSALVRGKHKGQVPSAAMLLGAVPLVELWALPSSWRSHQTSEHRKGRDAHKLLSAGSSRGKCPTGGTELAFRDVC